MVDFENHKEAIAYGGSAILFVFGIAAILKSRRPFIKKEINREERGFFRFLFKGLFINAFSPFVPIFWIGTMSLATVKYNYQGATLLLFFTTIVFVVFTTDILKAYLAQKLNVFVNRRVMKLLNITVGIILILFAVRMATYY